MADMKETKELLKGILDVVKVSADVLKDGFQVTDLVTGYTKLAGDPVMKADLEAALQNISAVPAEFTHLGVAEILDLAIFFAQEVPSLLAAFKKAPAAV